MPCVLSLDTPGFFACSPAVFSTLFDAWAMGTELYMAADSFSMPLRVIYLRKDASLAPRDSHGGGRIFPKGRKPLPHVPVDSEPRGDLNGKTWSTKFWTNILP